MSTQDWNKPTDPDEPYQPPETQSGHDSPSYEPPAWGAPGAQPQEPYQPPASQPYEPPAQAYGATSPGTPPQQPQQPYQPYQPYQPPAAQPYGGGSQPYGAPAQPYGAGTTPGTPPQLPYGQPPVPGGSGAPYQGQYPQPYPGAAYPAPQVPTAMLASWGTRALGGLIDYVVPALLFSMLAGPFAPTLDFETGVTSGGNAPVYWLFNTLLPLVWWVYNSGYRQGTTGQTVGKQVAKTRLVSEATGQPIGFLMAVVRHIAHIIDSVICMIGWLFPLWDSKRQTIADKLMKTVVVVNQP